MGVVAVGAILFAVLLVVVALMVWQEASRTPETAEALYLLPEATRFVYDRLSESAVHRIDLDDVKRILELGLYYHQVERRGDERRPVVGSGEAIEYIMERASAGGSGYEPIDIAEVMAAETEYLVSIGALGAPADSEGEQ